jgi:hypothetical protein
VGTDLVQQEPVTGAVKWTRYDFTSSWRDVSIAFSLFKAEQHGAIAIGDSPEQARSRLAAALESRPGLVSTANDHDQELETPEAAALSTVHGGGPGLTV